MNAVCVYDFTFSEKKISFEILKTWLVTFCKKWCFQLEEGKGGFLHYQGRFSLKIKKRLNELKPYMKGWHISITSCENRDNMFYVMKDERTDGPWCDKDADVYIPKQYRHEEREWFPFQKQILEDYGVFNDRKINLVTCLRGKTGKSYLGGWIELHNKGFVLPCMNDADKLIQCLMCYCMDRSIRDIGLLIVDMPRSLDSKNLNGMFTALELIKSGKLYDWRYHYKSWWIDSPNMWVFTNAKIDPEMLSSDRWVLWVLDHKTKGLRGF